MEIIFGRIVWIFLVRLIFFNDFVSADWLVLMAFSRLTFAIRMIKLFAYKYKCLWNVGGKGRGSNVQKRILYIYTLRLG